MTIYARAEKDIQNILSNSSSSQILHNVVSYLYDHFKNYHWVGIYLLKGKQLVLGPWRGVQATEHTTIPVGKGICGAAAQTGNTEIVNDVSKDDRYLACFRSTRSEIVVPIKKGGQILGEIDIDSDHPDAFTGEDAAFLEKVADMLSQHI